MHFWQLVFSSLSAAGRQTIFRDVFVPLIRETGGIDAYLWRLV